MGWEFTSEPGSFANEACFKQDVMPGMFDGLPSTMSGNPPWKKSCMPTFFTQYIYFFVLPRTVPAFQVPSLPFSSLPGSPQALLVQLRGAGARSERGAAPLLPPGKSSLGESWSRLEKATAAKEETYIRNLVPPHSTLARPRPTTSGVPSN